MKVLHYSDQSVKNFDELYFECDVLFVTGDLTLFDFGKLENIPDKKPAFGVYGNHDSGRYFEPLKIRNLHNTIYKLNSLKIGGFQGCLRYKETGLMYTEDDAKIFAGTFPRVDILLLHAGPKDLLDDPSDPVHVGSVNIRSYVVEKKPKFVFLGHQYSNAEMEFEQTKLFRTYGARIIEI